MIKTSTNYELRPVSVAQREQWDAFVASHPYGHLLQSWAWGELKATAEWHPLRLALWDGAQMVAAAQVLRKTAPHVPLQAGHLAYIPKGPVIDWSQVQLCATFFAQLNAYLRKQGAIAMRLEPGIEQGTQEGEVMLKQLSSLGMRPARSVQPLRTIMLDLEPDEATLLAQMKEKWRYNIRLGGRKGITVRIATSEDDIRTWYDIYQATSTRDEFGIHSLEYYLLAWHLFSPDDTLRLYLAEHEGDVLAGIFVSVFAGQGLYLYGASSNEKRQLMPNYVLQWEAIRWAKQRGASVYDFWGIPDTDGEDEEMAGVYRFKRGWGGHVVQFTGCYEHVYRPLLMSVASRFL